MGQTDCMAVGRAERREHRRDRVEAALGKESAQSALDLLELIEMAWHDCYGEVSPPEDVVDDMLLVSRGDLGRFVSAAHLAVVDSRDLRVAADGLRNAP
jgi:hypothetical protein